MFLETYRPNIFFSDLASSLAADSVLYLLIFRRRRSPPPSHLSPPTLSSVDSSLSVSSSLPSLLDVKEIDLRGDNSSTPKGLHTLERSYRSNQNTPKGFSCPPPLPWLKIAPGSSHIR